MSEQPSHRTSTPEDEASEAGATSEGFGNLSIEDDAEGTVNPADLAGTGAPDADAVDGQEGGPNVGGVEQPSGTG
jgi:hypothetical protein